VAVSNVHIHLPNHNKCMILHNACFCMLFSEKKTLKQYIVHQPTGTTGKKVTTWHHGNLVEKKAFYRKTVQV
jgi:hypothetical protein